MNEYFSIIIAGLLLGLGFWAAQPIVAFMIQIANAILMGKEARKAILARSRNIETAEKLLVDSQRLLDKSRQRLTEAEAIRAEAEQMRKIASMPTAGVN